GRHKESGELRCIFTESIDNVEKISNHANRRGYGIGPPVPHEEFAPVSLKLRQVGIGGVHEFARRQNPRGIGVKVESQGIPTRTEDKDPEVCVCCAGYWSRPSNPPGPSVAAILMAVREPWMDLLLV